MKATLSEKEFFALDDLFWKYKPIARVSDNYVTLQFNGSDFYFNRDDGKYDGNGFSIKQRNPSTNITCLSLIVLVAITLIGRSRS